MARAIDAVRFGEIMEQWKKDCLEDNDTQGADIISDVILQLDDMPTLTPPNEPLTCDGCISLGTSYGPCVNCIRSRLRKDMYRRPPEEAWDELEKRMRGM